MEASPKFAEQAAGADDREKEITALFDELSSSGSLRKSRGNVKDKLVFWLERYLEAVACHTLETSESPERFHYRAYVHFLDVGIKPSEENVDLDSLTPGSAERILANAMRHFKEGEAPSNSMDLFERYKALRGSSNAALKLDIN